MDSILQDLSPVNLVTGFEENLSAWIPVFGALGRTYVDDPPGVKRSITDISISLVNSVMDARLASDHVDAAIEHILADARSRNVPVTWWIVPSTRPTDLGKHLEEHGFEPGEELPVMAVDLQALNENLPAPAGLKIQHVEDDASWRLFGRIAALANGSPESECGASMDFWHAIFCAADPGRTLAYIAWWNDQPVATSILMLAAGVAGISVHHKSSSDLKKGAGLA